VVPTLALDLLVTDSSGRVFVHELLMVVDGLLAMNTLGNRAGHMPACDFGIYTGNCPSRTHPNGAPCSKRCREAQAAANRARQWLEAS
jgi:hypothetical protein